MEELILKKILPKLDDVYNKYVLDICGVQANFNQYKADSLKKDNTLNKQIEVVDRIF